MTKQPPDLEFWKRYTNDIDESPKETPKDQLWEQVIKNLDSINTHRSEYLSATTKHVIPKVSPTSNYLSPPDPVYTVPSRIDVQQFDRQEKRRFKRTLSDNCLTLDLHGYTLKQAYAQLQRTISNAYARRIPLVKVITGKGTISHLPDRPTLRRILPSWVQDATLSPMVIKIRKAPSEHGGDGAFFLFIRKP